MTHPKTFPPITLRHRLAVLLALSGCSTTFVPEAIGGSRSDGTVTMAYSFGMFQKPVVDWAQVDTSAAQRCAVWGYTSAQRLGAGRQPCNRFNGYGNCVEWNVLIDYQCTGAPAR